MQARRSASQPHASKTRSRREATKSGLPFPPRRGRKGAGGIGGEPRCIARAVSAGPHTQRRASTRAPAGTPHPPQPENFRKLPRTPAPTGLHTLWFLKDCASCQTSPRAIPRRRPAGAPGQRALAEPPRAVAFRTAPQSCRRPKAGTPPRHRRSCRAPGRSGAAGSACGRRRRFAGWPPPCRCSG